MILTHPPLSLINRHPEGICLISFVRLACVRHAASVRPEPGSNSLKNGIKTKLGFVKINLVKFLAHLLVADIV